MNIFCCTCNKDIEAILVYGTDCYPHRKDLSSLKFYQCPVCKNFVGTHKGTDRPLGVIASTEIKKERMKIHSILDPLWKKGKIKRGELYAKISSKLGYEYHTAELRTIEDCHNIYFIVLGIKSELDRLENELTDDEIKKYCDTVNSLIGWELPKDASGAWYAWKDNGQIIIDVETSDGGVSSIYYTKFMDIANSHKNVKVNKDEFSECYH